MLTSLLFWKHTHVTTLHTSQYILTRRLALSFSPSSATKFMESVLSLSVSLLPHHLMYLPSSNLFLHSPDSLSNPHLSVANLTEAQIGQTHT